MSTSYRELIAVSLAYAVGVSGIYLFGFWGTFDVNVLEYIGISDLIKLAVYPLVATLAMLFVGFVHGTITSKALAPASPPPMGFALARAVERYSLLICLLLVGAIGAALSFLDAPNKWIAFATLSSFLSLGLMELSVLKALIPDHQLRATTLMLGTLVAGMAMYVGSRNAELAMQGRTDLIVDLVRSQIDLKESPDKPVGYLGHIGGYFALLETSTGHVVLIREESVATIHLVKNKRRHT